MRVVDEPLPSYRRAWFLEVDAHENEQIFSQPLRLLFKSLPVFECRLRIMNRAWADYNQQPVIATADDAIGLYTGVGHGD